jgi:hypothetical protein
MVIVVHSTFESRWGAGRLNAADQVFVDQYTDIGANVVGQLVGGAMRPRRNRVHDGQPLCSHLDPVATQKLFYRAIRVVHVV